jgi:hypothetical protein
MLVDSHLDLLTSADSADVLCEACQVKVKVEFFSYRLTDDRFNERSEGVIGSLINCGTPCTCILFVVSLALQPSSSSTRFRDHTQRRATVGRTPLDK